MSDRTQYHEVISLIRRVRESFPDAVKVYKEGSCVQFAMILREAFGVGDVVWNEDHSAYLLDGHYFDITGEIENDNYIPLGELNILQVDNLLRLRYNKPN